MHSRMSVSAAAELLNVSASTVQRLCNRGLLQFANTQGGHRRIEMRHITALRERLRGRSVELLDMPEATDFSVAHLSELLLTGREHEMFSWLVAYRYDSHALIGQLESHLLPALTALDSRFLRGQLQSHHLWLAVNTAKAALERLSAQLKPSGTNTRVAVGCALGETHNTLGNCLVELTLRAAGIPATAVGPVLSSTELAEIVMHTGARLVWLSHTHCANPAELINWHYKLADQLPSGVRVMIGGGALSPSIRRQLPPHAHYESLVDLLDGEKVQFKSNADQLTGRKPIPLNPPPLRGPHYELHDNIEQPAR